MPTSGRSDDRPVYLNLFAFHFPVMAIVSVLHRISGMFILFFLPLCFWLLQQALTSEGEFYAIVDLLKNSIILKLFIWVFSVSLILHVYAGIRHLIMDFGFGESLVAARISAWVVLCLAAVESCAAFVLLFVFWG